MKIPAQYLVIALFVGWCALCWNWYVCGIKGVCIPQSKSRELQPKTLSEPDTIPEIIQTVHDSVAPTPKTDKIAPEPKPRFAPNEINKVQLESVEDYMVVHFPYNSVRKEDNVAIDSYLSKLAKQLKESGKFVVITGHTDFVGDAQSNVVFGQKRAESIRDILIKKGVKRKQIKCNSFGDKKPVATNDTPQGRYKNRRVVIKVQNS
ncbi:MAG: OmpA family protein [Bacteroidetes bacterium]|nr:OmpA family protein [Bacteroidota bacterium]